MTRVDIKRCIKHFLDYNYASNNHSDCAEKLLSEYEQQIKTNVIDDLMKVCGGGKYECDCELCVFAIFEENIRVGCKLKEVKYG